MMKRIAVRQDIKDKAQASLLESLGAVQHALSALPDNVAKAPTTLAEAFIQIDPILSMLDRQLVDAQAHAAQLAIAFGAGDAMLEALQLQIQAIKKAYGERLELLRKKREESSRKTEFEKEFKPEGKLLPQVRKQHADQSRKNGALWSWAFLILMTSQSSAKGYGLRAA